MATSDRFDPGQYLNLPLSRRVARGVGLLLGVVAWYAIASVFPADLMPFPFETLAIAWDLVASGAATTHLFDTLWRTLWGFLGAAAIGVAIGVVMGTNDYSRQFALPYVVAGLSVPAIAWAAITTLVFGFSELAPITATIAVTFPFIAINVWKGVENIDAELVDMCDSFGVSRLRLLKRVIIPNAAPQLFAGTRFGLAISWKIVTIAEIFASSSGIGYKLIQAYTRYRFEQAWAWAILFIVVVLLIEYGVIRPLERRVYKYRHDTDLDLLL